MNRLTADQRKLVRLLRDEYGTIDPSPNFGNKLLSQFATPQPVSETKPAPRRGLRPRAYEFRWLSVSAAVVVVVGLIFGIVAFSADKRNVPTAANPTAALVVVPSSSSAQSSSAKTTASLQGQMFTTDPLTPKLPNSVQLSDTRSYPQKIGPAPAGSISMPWRLAALDASQKILTIYFAAGDGYCIKPIGVFVSEPTPSTVVLTVASTNSAQKASDCPSVLALGKAKIVLSTPLAGRSILHPNVSPEFANVLDSF